MTEFEKSIEFREHVNCCVNCKHGKNYLSIGGYEEIECTKFDLDVSIDSICQHYEGS